MHSSGIPCIAVVTKARSDNGFRAEVQKLLPTTANVLRVTAKEEQLDDGHIVKSSGLKDLADITTSLVPVGQQAALAAAQKVDIDLKKATATKL